MRWPSVYLKKMIRLFVSKAEGIGNLVVYVGPKRVVTGFMVLAWPVSLLKQTLLRKKPTVQIGDPFFEKLLIESCLDVMKKDWL